jgi:uncharacterized membrane protein
MTAAAIALALHVLSAVVWVGGMFFAYMVLRPVTGALLDPPKRLELWTQVFERFFRWVWAAVALLLGTGLWMIFRVYGGLSGLGWHMHVMYGVGVPMMLLFMHVYFAPYRRLRAAVAAGDWPAGGRQIEQIRRLVGINTLLGVIVVLAGGLGRYL